MRISVFPKGQLDAISTRQLTACEWIEMASELPIEGLELWSGMFYDTSASYVERIGGALADHDLEMPMLCVSTDFTNPDSDVRKAQFDEEVELMRIAHTLGGPGVSVRVLSGQAHPSVTRPQGLAWAAQNIRDLLPLAAELDITLALENHYKDGAWAYPEFAQRVDVYMDLLEMVGDDPHFGVQYDPSNAIVAGADSAEFLELVLDRVVTMQASDRQLAPGTTLDELRQSDGTIGYSPNLQHGVIGCGLNDYPRIFTALAGVGYDGWISIEDGVNGMADLRQSVDFICDARERYFGGSTAVRVATLERRRAAAGLPSRAKAAH